MEFGEILWLNYKDREKSFLKLINWIFDYLKDSGQWFDLNLAFIFELLNELSMPPF